LSIFAVGYSLYSIRLAAVVATCTNAKKPGQSMLAATLPMVVTLTSTFFVFANPSPGDPGLEPPGTLPP